MEKEAREYVKAINIKNIVSIDEIQLAQYMIEFNVGVSTEIRDSFRASLPSEIPLGNNYLP